MFIDTSGWLCILDERDERHRKAVELFESSRRLVTHSYVIAELVPLCQRRRFSREKTIGFLNELLADPSVEIIWVDESLTAKGVDLLKNRPDKQWSLCDAISFLIMDSEMINEGLTTDHHFEQAGLIKLLES